jgi:glycerol-3-phosphate dehydrogenase subunit B
MNNQEQIKCDLLVIGRGFAGMAAVAKASALGLKTVQAGSSSSFFLSSGLIDVLGVYPANKAKILQTPEQGLTKIRTDNPNHPYSKISDEKIFESLTFLDDFLKDAGLLYQTKNRNNSFILTAAGTFKPSYMVPKTFLNGCAKNLNGKRVLFVDFKGLKGYSARQIANVVHKICPQSSSLTIEVPNLSGDLAPMALANLFEDDHFLKMIAKKIQSKMENVDLVGFPATCGIHDSFNIVEKLEKLIGCPCFEIPGLPPSIPGLRLKNAFEKKISQHDVIVLNKAKIKFDSFKDHTFFMTAVNQNMTTSIQASGVILATGHFQGGGLHADRRVIEETVFNLPVFQPEQRSHWCDLNFFNPDGHAINQAGIETNEMFQPIDKKNNPQYEHLYAAGLILAHNDWVRLKSGSGVSCASAVTAVEHFYDAIKGGDHV